MQNNIQISFLFPLLNPKGKSILKHNPVNPKGNQSWLFTGRTDAEAETPTNTLATWCKKLTHLKRLRCWERLKAGGEGADRGWDGWMASPTRWTWVEQAPGVGDGQGRLACCSPWGCKRVRHDWATELNFLCSVIRRRSKSGTWGSGLSGYGVSLWTAKYTMKAKDNKYQGRGRNWDEKPSADMLPIAGSVCFI